MALPCCRDGLLYGTTTIYHPKRLKKLPPVFLEKGLDRQIVGC